MAWIHARCKCGGVLTRYATGLWRHSETYETICADGSDGEPISELVEVVTYRYLTREQADAEQA